MKAPEKSDADVAEEIKKNMETRNIHKVEDYLKYLRTQKETKKIKTAKRLAEVEQEITVIEKMLVGEL